MDLSKCPCPAYVLEESLLRKNLEKIADVRDKAGVEIVLAFKAFAMWKAFPLFKEYGFQGTTSSSLNEARLAYEEMAELTHSYLPAFTVQDFPHFLQLSKQITFNSLSQFELLYPQIMASGNHSVSCGLRINPEYSEVETDLYNPARPGGRLGIPAVKLKDGLPAGVEGLHFHSLCESDSYVLERTLQAVEKKFGHLFGQIQWLNLGGGHLITRKDYDTAHLIDVLRSFKSRYPHIHLIMEPGSAFVWQTGFLYAQVVDIVSNQGVDTAMLNVSFACHMPDCLEMPYKPLIRGASKPDEELYPYKYHMGGNSCLAGDSMGFWTFPHPLRAGDTLIFEDMIHYTVVKTHTFNGVAHPALCFLRQDREIEIWREYYYSDYKQRMD
ncbi:MAG: carboxynorspermidine decarboxylase [Bacteroidales bacterium]|nr:carboxynorspermidine decarboxylase [Bacteroidales bacterium]